MTTCHVAPDTAERYVSGLLPDSEQTAFEDHFFACDSCLQKVQALQDLQSALAAMPSEAQAAPAQPSRRVPPMTWMALAAMIVLSVIVLRMPRQPAGTSDAPTPAVQTDATRPAPPPATNPAPAVTTPAEDPLVRLSKITPPPYVALTTRSDSDPDAQAFANAMTHYAGGRFDQSSAALRVIVTSTPGLAHAQFFLGVSELMSNRPEAAQEAFERTIRTGVAPYADEAHFYLAKTALRAKDVGTARRELQTAIDREAGPRGEAARLLEELKTIQR